MEILREKKNLVQVGSSRALIIPAKWMDIADWKENDEFYIQLDLQNNEISIKKVIK